MQGALLLPQVQQVFVKTEALANNSLVTGELNMQQLLNYVNYSVISGDADEVMFAFA